MSVRGVSDKRLLQLERCLSRADAPGRTEVRPFSLGKDPLGLSPGARTPAAAPRESLKRRHLDTSSSQRRIYPAIEGREVVAGDLQPHGHREDGLLDEHRQAVD